MFAAADEVPLSPDASTAREWMLEELSKPEYLAAQPTWYDRIAQSIADWVKTLRLPEGTDDVTGIFVAIGVTVLVVVVVALAFLLYGRPALNRRSRVTGALFGEDDARSAAEIRQAAERAARNNEWQVATQERFRAIAREMAERTIFALSPGTTAHGFARAASRSFPDQAAELSAAATAFDEVRYLGGSGTSESYLRVSALDEHLRTAAPATRQAVTA